MKYLFLFFCLFLCSCEYSEPPGRCSEEPTGLSKKKLLFNADVGIDSVTTKERFWLSSFIRIGDTTVYYSYHPIKYCLKKDTCSFLYSYEGNISYLLMEKKYENGEKYLDSNDVGYIKSYWFTVNRPDEKKMIFSVTKNETAERRHFDIILRTGNCADVIEVTQSAE